MEEAVERVAFPFTFLLKREGEQWASICRETGIASCGDTLDAARDALMDAIEASFLYLLEQGRPYDIWQPMSAAETEEFRSGVPGECTEESMVMVAVLDTEAARAGGREGVHLDFVRSVAACSPSDELLIVA